MIRKIHIFLILICSILAPTVSGKSQSEIKALSDSLYADLKRADNPADSLVIMGNLFDLLSRTKGGKLGLKMFDVANRAGNYTAALDIIRNLSNIYMRNDSMLVALYNRTLRYSKLNNGDKYDVNLDDLHQTRTFIKLTRNICQAYYSTPEERRDMLVEFMQNATVNPPSSLYDRIVLHHAICMLLSQMGANDILSEKLDELGELINQLPSNAIAIRNAYTVHAAIAYSDNNEFEKSMQADLKTLDGIDHLEKKYREQGRIYKNFDANRYIIYTRFLSNFPMLSPQEIDNYYKMAMELVEKDPASATTNKVYPGPQIYYNIANKNYGKALEYIKSCIDDPNNSKIRRRLLKLAITSAEAIGDKETQLNSSKEYIKLLESTINQRLDEKYRELQVISDSSELNSSYNKLQLEKQNAESHGLRLMIIIALVAACILLIMVIVLLRLNRKNKNLLETLDKSNHTLLEKSRHLEKSREQLVEARDMAQKANNLKTDFIKNMSYEVNAPLKAINEYCKLIVDCADASNRKYLERFTSLVELNSDLLTTIVNDVLHISEIDSDSVPIQRQSTDLRNLCELVIEGVGNRLAPGVTLRFDETSPDINLFTDPQHLHQILLNLLINATKFTKEGSITLGYTLDPATSEIVFSVTDTGIGINPDKKDIIFERFVKLDKTTQGAGLGLAISRMLARLMDGDLVLDTSYNGGARFLLILPKK